MAFLIIVGIIIFIGIFIFVNIKIGELHGRAREQILKGSGFSTTELSEKIYGEYEKKHIQQISADYPNYTEDNFKNILKEYSMKLVNKEQRNEFSQTVNEKMQNDSKLEKLKEMEFKRINITKYKNPDFNAIAVFSDSKDEYNMYLIGKIENNYIALDNYRIQKGQMEGF